MSDEQKPHSVTYNYHNSFRNSSISPAFILVYIQCAMFLLNAYLKINLELWQLIFPTFVMAIMLVIGYYNSMNS
jgi:hypothetical protein